MIHGTGMQRQQLSREIAFAVARCPGDLKKTVESDMDGLGERGRSCQRIASCTCKVNESY